MVQGQILFRVWMFVVRGGGGGGRWGRGLTLFAFNFFKIYHF